MHETWRWRAALAAPAAERDPSRFAPVFVVAPPRSYSSVVAAMVGRHPALVGLPELKLFCCQTLGELEASLPRWARAEGIAHRSPGLVRAVAQLQFGDQSATTLVRALAWLHERPTWTGAAVFDLLQDLALPRAVVEKSPDDVATDEALARMAAAYPEARFLHLTRHPVTSVRSMYDHWCRTVPGLPVDEDDPAWVEAWLGAHRRVLGLGETLPARRYLRARAEDVLDDPDSELRRVARWLGVAADDTAIDAMKHPELSPFACFAPAASGVAGGYDPAFLADPVPRRVEVPVGLEPPPATDTGAAALWVDAMALARELGYGTGR